MKNIGYYNGETGLLEDLKVPFLDRVSFYGDGVYDATMALDGVVVFAEDHIDRFFNSCANMEINPDTVYNTHLRANETHNYLVWRNIL